MRSVPEPAAHPVLALIMCIDENPTSGYGERRAFVERVAVLVVERHDGALRPGEATVASVEIHVRVIGYLPRNVDGFGEPETRKQPASRPNGLPNADLA